MDSKLFNIIERFESSFSRKATYHCFTLLIIGLIVRSDHYGLSRIVRWLSLMSNNYWQILNFFNSTGWSLPGILLCWWSYCLEEAPCLMDCCMYLVMDAFFAIGPVFLAASVYSIALRTPLVHIITRAKKGTVAYLDPEPDSPGKRGRKKQYGEKIKLKRIFEQRVR